MRAISVMFAIAVVALLAMSVPAVSVVQASGGSDWNYITTPITVRVSNGPVLPGQGANPFSSGGLIAYTPQDIQSAYNFNALYKNGYNGAGETIVIVDAYGSPTIGSDLATFDNAFGLPAPPSFTVIYPAGSPSFNPNNAPLAEISWSFETTLDVDYAHAMAPGANIVLAVAPTPAGNAINAVESYVIQNYPGSVMSQSFGIPEAALTANNAQVIQAEANYAQAVAQGITLVASAGDAGASNGYSFPNPSFPSSDPYVLAVGGTMGLPYPQGLVKMTKKGMPIGYGDEQVWNEPVYGAATGGAPSLFFSTPSYQNGLGLSSRTTPDVAYNAAVNGGVLVYYSAVPLYTGWWIFGGTSAGSPQWSALLAIAKQYAASNGYSGFGFVNGAIYALAESSSYSSYFHDITVGNNTLNGTTVGFTAQTGFDYATGWGTPDASYLVPALAAVASSENA